MKFKQFKKRAIFVLITFILILTFSLTALADMIFIEAESGKQSSARMIIGNGLGAFNDAYIYGETNSDEIISYEFEIKEAGDYYLWFRLMGQDDAHDSFFVMIDGAGFNQSEGFDKGEYNTFDMWEESEGYEYSASNPFLPSLENHKDTNWLYNPNWHWIPLSYRDATVDPPIRHNLITQNFTAGKHTMEIMTREPECYLDKIIITNDLKYDPRGIAGDPEVAWLAANQPVVAEEPAPAGTAADEPAAVAEPAAVVEPAPPAPPVAVAPKTSDNILVYLSILLLAAGAITVRRRNVKVK